MCQRNGRELYAIPVTKNALINAFSSDFKCAITTIGQHLYAIKI
jgi:hypothetical protein